MRLDSAFYHAKVLIQVAQLWKLTSGKLLEHSHVTWWYSSLLIGHELTPICWCKRRLRRCHNRERLPKCPMIQSITSSSIKVPALGEVPGHSQLNLSKYKSNGLCVSWASASLDRLRPGPSPPRRPEEEDQWDAVRIHMVVIFFLFNLSLCHSHSLLPHSFPIFSVSPALCHLCG